MNALETGCEGTLDMGVTFVDPEGLDSDPDNDFQLKLGIDIGDNGTFPDDEFDLDGDTVVAEAMPVDLLPPNERIQEVLDYFGVVTDMGAYELAPQPCPWDCFDGDGEVGIGEFLSVLGTWGLECPEAPCDLVPPAGVGIEEFLAVIGKWDSCMGGEGPPESVEDCIDRYGSSDPEVLLGCVCMFEPCEEGCPPDPECE